MARIYLPTKEWPLPDQIAWEDAIRPGDILDGQGPATHWRPATRTTNVQHYSRWLGYLHAIGALDPAVTPTDRITRDHIQGYVAHLKEQVAPRTMVSALVGLKVMIKAMAPEESWRWLSDICNALNRTARPVTDKRSRMRDTGEIVRTAIARMDRLLIGPLVTRLDRVAFRDSLMLALLAARPLRLKNFTALARGQHLIQVAKGWEIYIPGEETKTGQPLHVSVPELLVPYLNTYLERVRPTFLKPDTQETNRLWLGFKGRPLTAHSLYCRIIVITELLLGRSINPHLLRDCAATTLSTKSPEDALTAAALLGHRNFRTTERYYIRANQLEASRQVGMLIDRIRSGVKEDS
jgi:integrase/recombinase XerD